MWFFNQTIQTSATSSTLTKEYVRVNLVSKVNVRAHILYYIVYMAHNIRVATNKYMALLVLKQMLYQFTNIRRKHHIL